MVAVDTDYAGCKKTRKSTSGGVAMIGGHMIKSWSTTQAVIALSSGEAEFYGIVKGSSIGIGLRSVLADLGVDSRIQVHTDASAAKGIAMRRGLGTLVFLTHSTVKKTENLKSPLGAPASPVQRGFGTLGFLDIFFIQKTGLVDFIWANITTQFPIR